MSTSGTIGTIGTARSPAADPGALALADLKTGARLFCRGAGALLGQLGWAAAHAVSATHSLTLWDARPQGNGKEGWRR